MKIANVSKLILIIIVIKKAPIILSQNSSGKDTIYIVDGNNKGLFYAGVSMLKML